MYARHRTSSPSASLRSLHAGLLVCLTALALCSPLSSSAQDADAPARVARLGLVEGNVQQRLAEDGSWRRAEQNIPLTSGDSLRTDGTARAELTTGATTLRLGNNADLEISALDDNSTRLTLNQGSLQLRVHQLYPDEQLEINTPNLAMVITQPGNYRLDVNPNDATTRASAQSGAATLFGESGASAPLNTNGQRQIFAGRNLTRNRAPEMLRQDDFDWWATARDRGEDQSISARFVSRDTIGYQELDQNGDWANDAQYGSVWFPRVTVNNWAPYRYGQWRWVAPWGWTWVDDAPWGFAPFHYGRWAKIGPRWAWVPGPRQLRPAYAPALIGVPGAPIGMPPSGYRGGRPGTPPPANWFPLAPGEAWQPGYRSNQRTLGSINRGTLPPEQTRRDGYRFENRPGAFPPPRAGGPGQDTNPYGRQDRYERNDRNGRNDNRGRPPQQQYDRDATRPNPRMSLDPYPNGNAPRPMQPRERPQQQPLPPQFQQQQQPQQIQQQRPEFQRPQPQRQPEQRQPERARPQPAPQTAPAAQQSQQPQAPLRKAQELSEKMRRQQEQ